MRAIARCILGYKPVFALLLRSSCPVHSLPVRRFLDSSKTNPGIWTKQKNEQKRDRHTKLKTHKNRGTAPSRVRVCARTPVRIRAVEEVRGALRLRRVREKELRPAGRGPRAKQCRSTSRLRWAVDTALGSRNAAGDSRKRREAGNSRTRRTGKGGRHGASAVRRNRKKKHGPLQRREHLDRATFRARVVARSHGDSVAVRFGGAVRPVVTCAIRCLVPVFKSPHCSCRDPQDAHKCS